MKGRGVARYRQRGNEKAGAERDNEGDCPKSRASRFRGIDKGLRGFVDSDRWGLE